MPDVTRDEFEISLWILSCLYLFCSLLHMDLLLSLSASVCSKFLSGSLASFHGKSSKHEDKSVSNSETKSIFFLRSCVSNDIKNGIRLRSHIIFSYWRDSLQESLCLKCKFKIEWRDRGKLVLCRKGSKKGQIKLTWDTAMRYVIHGEEEVCNSHDKVTKNKAKRH